MPAPPFEPDSPEYLQACQRLGAEVARWLPVGKLRALGDMAVGMGHYPLTAYQAPIWSADNLGVDVRLYVKHTGAAELTPAGAWCFLQAARERCLALFGDAYRMPDPHLTVSRSKVHKVPGLF